MKKNRVVVTGMGAVAPNGIGTEVFWNALVEGKSGIRLIQGFDAQSFPSRIAGEISNLNADNYMNPRSSRRSARFTRFAAVAAGMAAEQAGIAKGETESSRKAVYIGSASGGMDIFENEHEKILQNSINKMSPYGASAYFPNSAATQISIALGFTGQVITISTGCTCGLDAVGAAFEEISLGNIDIAVCGGTDGSVTPLTLGSFCAAGILSKLNDFPSEASRPFDSLRDGGVISEGAGILVLEEERHAVSRGADIHGVLMGFSAGAQASNLFENDTEGAGFVKEMRNAMDRAQITASDVDYICAHAPSDVIRDAAETNAIKLVFGKRAYKIPVSSIKSMIGNPLASAAPLQLIASLMAINTGIVPPTINYRNPDPSCDLDYVPNTARRNRVRTALINSHGFGGSNASAVIGEYPGGLN